jgi:hypothetical protein
MCADISGENLRARASPNGAKKFLGRGVREQTRAQGLCTLGNHGHSGRKYARSGSATGM